MDVKEMTREIENGVRDIFESGRFQEYLDVMSRFYNYSFGNCVLIAAQKPDATLVAGYRAWQKNFNRQVKRGSQGIRIIQPVPYKYTKEFKTTGPDGTEEIENRLVAGTGFKVGTVFDVSQTEGEPLPELAETLTGDVADFSQYIDALQSVAGVPIVFEDLKGRLSQAQGYFSEAENRIVIKAENDEMQQLKTAFHEVAHSLLHRRADSEGVDRQTKEVQAESIAYVTMKAFGFDTAGYSFGYVAAWCSGRDTPELKKSVEVIQKTAASIITRTKEQLALRRTVKEELAPVMSLRS